MEKTNLKFYSRNNNFENYDLNSIFKKSTEKLTYENSIKNKYSSEKNNKKLKMIYNYCYKSNQNIEKMPKSNNKTELSFKFNIDNNKKKNDNGNNYNKSRQGTFIIKRNWKKNEK